MSSIISVDCLLVTEKSYQTLRALPKDHQVRNCSLTLVHALCVYVCIGTKRVRPVEVCEEDPSITTPRTAKKKVKTIKKK